MTIIPKNPIFIFATLFVPWRYFGTSIQINKDAIVFNRYFCKSARFEKDTTSFKIEDVRKIGFPKDFRIQQQEDGLSGIYGVYLPQEIDFILSNKKIVSLNARPYTKHQIETLIKIFPTDIEYGKMFSQLLKK